MSRIIQILAVSLLFFSLSSLQAQTYPPNGQIYNWTYQSGLGTNWDTSPYKPYVYNQMPFRMMFPKNFDSLDVNSKRPVFIFLHGKGEGGVDNNIQLKWGGAFLKKEIEDGDFPGFAIFPQSTNGFWNNTHYDRLIALLEILHTRYHIDLSRVYVSGLSAGGYGAWELMNRYPQYIAAAIPMSASSVIYRDFVPNIVHIPKWLSQGGKDNAPAPNTSQQVLNAFKDGGGEIRYSYYPDNGHNTWEAMWANPFYLPFLLQYSKLTIHTFFNKTEFCPGDVVSTKIGISPGFQAYEWAKDGVVIPSATSNNYDVTAIGDYTVRYMKSGVWSPWSQPVTIRYEDASVTPPITTVGLQSVALPDLGGKTSVTLAADPTLIGFQWTKVGSPTVLGASSTYVATTAGQYVVTARKPDGCYALSSLPFLVTYGRGAEAPPSPNNLLLNVMSQTTIQLSWDENPTPQFNETAFEVYRAISAQGPFNLVKITAQDQTTYTDTGLLPNTTYFYRIRAINHDGYSLTFASNSATTLVDNEAPSIPQNLTAVGAPTSITLSWDESTDNVGILRYEVYQFGNLIANTPNTSFTVLGVTQGNLYAYTVRAVDISGNKSSHSAQVVQKAASNRVTYSYYEINGMSVLPNFNQQTPVKTGIIDNFDITLRERETNYAFKFDAYINIPTTGTYTFETSSDDGSKLYIGGYDEANLLVNNDGLHGTVTRSATKYLTAGQHPITVTFFQGGGGQNLTVRWQIPGGSKVVIPNSAFISEIGNVVVPAAPTGVVGTALSYDAIQLSWNDVSGETGYEIYRSSNAGQSYEIVATTAANVTSLTDRLNIAPSTSYFYKIKAINNNGASPFGGGDNTTTLTYKYYHETGMTVLPNFNSLTPVKQGTVDSYNLSMRTRDDNFAVYFDGYINVPVSGTYLFETNSDDGSKLYIGDYNEANLVVNNDGLHGAQARQGTKVLNAGTYRIIVTYFEATGGQSITVRWQVPGSAIATIPASALLKNYTTVLSLPLPAVPQVPVLTNVTPISTSRIDLSWTGNQTTSDGFEVYRATGVLGEFRLYETVSAQTFAFSSTGLFPHLTYRYKIRAFNAGGYSAFSNEVSVMTLNTNPIIDSDTLLYVRYGTTATKVFTAIDADGDLVSYSLLSLLPDFATFNDENNGSSTLHLTPSISDIGVYSVSIIANDGFGGADTLEITIDVNSNNPPVIGEITNQHVTEGDTLLVDFSLIDIEGEDIVLTGRNLPSFITLVNNEDGTGTLVVTPKFNHQGTYQNITVVATDINGASSEETFSLVVVNVETDHAIYLNFNDIYFGASPWINTGIPAPNKVIENLTNDKGTATTIDLVTVVPFEAAYRLGQITGNNSGVYPDNVIREFHYFFNGSPVFKFKDLNRQLTYDFTFYGNSTYGSTQGETRYTINNVTVVLDVTANTQNTVQITGVKPDVNGEVVITFSKAANIPVGYINAMVVESYYDDGLAPAAPVLNAVSESSNGLTLAWTDNSLTETGFVIYRSEDGISYTSIGSVAKDVEVFEDDDVMGGSPYYYFVSAINLIGNTNSNTLSAVAPNRAPQIAPLLDISVFETSTTLVQVSVSDSEGDDISFENSILPDFVSISAVNNGGATLTVAPSTNDIGRYNLRLIATDSYGNSNERVVNLVVKDRSKKSILINFSQTAREEAPSPWNNTKNPSTGLVVSNLIDSNGDNTGVSMTFNSTGWESQTFGQLTGDNGGVYGDNVIFSYHRFNSSPSLTFKGLNPTKKYNFIFFGSVSVTNGNGPTRYTIGSNSVDLVVQNNAYKYANINGISPSGTGDITVNLSRVTGTGYGYINAIEIIEVNQLDKPLRPEWLKLKSVSRTAVSLQWRDDANNEYFYEVVRATSADGPYSSVAILPQNTTSYTDNTVVADQQYYYKISAVNGQGSSGFSQILSVHTPAFQIFINVNGLPTYNAGSPWNNLNTIPNIGDEYYNLLDDQGINRGVSLAQNGSSFTGAEYTGPTTGNNSGMYPDAVLRSLYYLNDVEHSYLTFGNLLPGYKYRLILYGSIVIGAKNVNKFTIGDQIIGLVTHNNLDKTAIFHDLKADQNGEIRLKIEGGPGTQWAVLNSIIIQGYTDENAFQTRYASYDTQTDMIEDINVYPTLIDESNELITVELGALAVGSVEVTISDIQGRVLYVDYFTAASQSTIQIPTDNLSSGSFILSIKSDSFEPVSKRLFKE